MRSNFYLLLLFCIITVTAYAQNDQALSLNIGDPAPPLRVCAWLKGTPVQRFEKGNVYVVEFWATWCKPCIAAMPHLSAFAAEYKDRITILGIDVYEKKNTSLKKVKAFVDSMGHRMDYHVAVGESNFMEIGWFDASGSQGIPKSFVVNAEGRLAWIGHPKDLGEVLPKIVNNTWNMTEELAKRNEQKRLEHLDHEANYTLMKYSPDQFKPGSVDRPDSALLAINEMVRNEPKLKYAPYIAYNTFSALLKTDLHKAYQYAKVAIVTSTYDDPPYDLIIGAIEWYSDKLNLPPEIYELGAEAYQVKIDHYPYPELVKIPKYYHNMADWYWRANNKSKAIDAEQKAIDALKSKKGFSKEDMAAFKSRLQQYKKM